MTVGAVQRPTLARRIGLPRHTVSDLLAILESRGLVRVAGDLDGFPGRSQFTYSLRANAALSLGFAVGGTRLAGALCDISGATLAEHDAPVARTGAAGLMEQIAAMADALCREAGLPRFNVRHTAIGAPADIGECLAAHLASAWMHPIELLPTPTSLPDTIERSRQATLATLFGPMPQA